ncbi:hypothetical protein QJU87_04190 [Pasteurella skyensis]|uniref:hypothetical protein n=1 Tax=Phocoenobacter skyensis TaxID=97481 RepID=UPI00275D0435|nr:hypothetical protein [Pasteurella skyensis]MDP8189064.1 hypothetical protein [Pasteurella skyensis]
MLNKVKLSSLFSFILLFLLCIVLMLLISHFAMQYGVKTGDIQTFLADTMFIWLSVRCCIYIACGYFLRKLLRLAKNEQDKVAYKKLIRTFIIALIIIEAVILVQQGG